MTSIRVESEIGRLRRVLIHRPGREIEWMVPAMMEELLFDDILCGEDAREEHDGFRRLLESAGVGTFDAGSLLAETLMDAEVRGELLADLGDGFALSRRARERLAQLEGPELARALIGGLRSQLEREAGGSFFDLSPVPNYFFQRDPQVVLGDRVMISSMATGARRREPLLARALFRHHGALEGAGEIFEIDRPALPSAGYAPSQRPNIEGGDVLVPNAETLLVGISERTNRRGVERLAEHLQQGTTSFRNLFLVELRARRAYMHLDTVFTFIDRGVCLGYPPVIEGGGAEAASVYQVDLTSRQLTFTLRRSLREALCGVGMDLELVPCGGEDLLFQQREQWTDGANAFAVAPGVIVLYQRNRATVEELSRRGWRVLDEEEILSQGVDPLGGGRTVITMVGNELSRARGGPRCMTMPLEREPV